MDKSKKGISPLIATVLIIGFTVALAAVIMTWGTKFTKDIQESTSSSANANMVCAQDVTLNIEKVCKRSDADLYKIVVSNEGNYDITDYRFKFYKNSNTVQTIKRGDNANTQTIIKFGVAAIDTGVSGDGGDLETAYSDTLQKVELIPTVTLKDGSTLICSQSAASFGDVGADITDLCE